MSFSEHRVRLKDIIEPKQHIFGQHTIHILPFSTASLEPTTSTSSLASCFCLDTSKANSEVTIPVLFNNTEPQYLSYSITPFDGIAEPSIFNITIPKSSLLSVGGSSESREMLKRRDDKLDLELDDVDDQRREAVNEGSRAVVHRGRHEVGPRSSHLPLSSSHRTVPDPVGLVFQMPVKQVGRVKLERVLDKNRFDARLSRSEVMVVECPSMSFAPQGDARALQARRGSKETSNLQHHCPGEEAILDVRVRGLAPLELTYSRSLDAGGRRQQQSRSSADSFTISHIAGNSAVSNPFSSEEDRGRKLAMLLSAGTQHPRSFDWAVARDIHLPVTMEFSTPGRYQYDLEQVKDACGNAARIDAVSVTSRQEVQVHPRRHASFVGCDGRHPINLLQGGQKKDVYIHVDSTGQAEGPFQVQVRYQGAEADWHRNITIMEQRASLTIDQPGTYSLEGVQGPHCAGEVGLPWMCTAREIPPPTAAIEVDPIQDQCAGSVGVKALAILSGTPPFRIKYTIQPKGKPMSMHEKVIDRTRDEIEFRPSAEGQITYTFTGLSDANYRDIKLDGPSFTQNLHPIAKAEFAGTQQTRGPAVVLYSCEGNTSTADVRLEGVGPFELSYAVRTRGGELAYTKQIKGISSNIYPLQVQVPPQVAEKGGLLTVTLTSIKDAKGCERPLTTLDLSIDVRRSKPTITFVEPRETVMLEGSEASLPVRLAGEGPWNVRYRRQGEDGPGILTVLNKAEASLVVAKAGNYVLEEVSDQHCPGSVVAAKSTHTVTIRPRPKAVFELDESTQVDRAGALSRRPVCAGVPDLVNVRLEGHSPIEIAYLHRLPGKDAIKERFTSAQNMTAIQLFTGVPGQHSYELLSVGDAIYTERPLPPDAAFKKIYQDVFPLPDVVIASSLQSGSSKAATKSSSLCVGDSLSKGQGSAGSTTLSLSGKAPFALDIEIKDGLGVTRKVLTRRGIKEHEHVLDIDAHEFVFDKTGKWNVQVTRVQDSNGCERFFRPSTVAVLGEESRTNEASRARVQVDVVETANISAVELRADHCVGETIEYVLQGTPPWTVAYDFEGKVSHAPVRTPTFSRVAEKPGKLEIRSIAHQHNKCQNVVEGQSGMKKTIHPLPTVFVRGGTHYIEDLREGNQAEIVFTLQGQPPFSFSIQRTQAVDRVQLPTVLESHTVTDIQQSSYSLFTAEEGTWSVTWLRDRYCEVSLDAVPV